MNILAILLTAILGIAALPGLAQPYTADQTKSILTQKDGLPCDPQHGADNSYYSAGCCGSPGNRECAYVLHFGKGPWGDSAGCTDPGTNVLTSDFYNGTIPCNFPYVLPEVPSSIIQLPNKPPIRDFQFFVTSDLHFYRIWYDINDQIAHPARLNLMNRQATVQGHPFSAVIVPGDLTTGPNAPSLSAYRSLWESGNLPGSSIELPVYFGLGNHDTSARPGGFGAPSADAQRIWEYLDTRMSLEHIDTSKDGCLPGVDSGCQGYGSFAGSHNYSWDWQGVHMMMLNTWAGDTDRAYTPPFAMNGMAWLARDLDYYVGNSGRPVILFQHYTLADANPGTDNKDHAWSPQNRSDFIAAIKKYNVVGLFDGHTHGLASNSESFSINQPAISVHSPGSSGGTPGTTLDEFVDGSGGDCHHFGDAKDICSNAVSNFLTVHVSDKYLDVTANSWVGDIPTFTDSSIGFRGRSGLTRDGFCRKRMSSTYIDVTDRVSLNLQPFGKKITVTNTGGSNISGALAVQIYDDTLNNWDFVDSCDAKTGNGNAYLLLSENGLRANSSLTAVYDSPSFLAINNFKVFQLSDSLASTDHAPVVGVSAVQLQVSSLSGAAVPFTYAVDPYTTGDLTQWLSVTADTSTTPATFTLTANKLPSYTHLTASLTITPSDVSIAPLTIPVILAPASFSTSSNVTNGQFLFDGATTGIPYSNVVTPNSVHKIDVTTPQYPFAGIQYNFDKWTNGGPSLQSVTVPFGGLALKANFNISYQLKPTNVPANGGSVVFTPPAGPVWYPAGDIHVKAIPNKNYYFTGFTGGLSATAPNATLNLRSPLSFNANFAANPAVTVTTNISGAEGSTVSLNGTAGTPPATGQFAPGSSVSISAPATFLSSTNPGIRYAFQQWSDGNTASQRSIAVGTTALNFSAQYSSANSTSVPQLYAAVAGQGTDAVIPGTPPQAVRLLPLLLKNVGPGTATAAQIDSVTGVQIVSGTGTVSAVLPAPIVVGNLGVNSQASIGVNFVWPASAIRVRMTVNFSANGGAYKGSTILNMFR